MNTKEKEKLMKKHEVLRDYCTEQWGPICLRPTEELIGTLVKLNLLDVSLLRTSHAFHDQTDVCLLDYCIEYGYFEEALKALELGADCRSFGNNSDRKKFRGPNLPIVRFMGNVPHYEKPLDKSKRYAEVESFLERALRLGLTATKRSVPRPVEIACWHLPHATSDLESAHYANLCKLLLRGGQMLDSEEGARALAFLILNVKPNALTLEVAKMLVDYGADRIAPGERWGGRSTINIQELVNDRRYQEWDCIFDKSRAEKERDDIAKLLMKNERIKWNTHGNWS